MARGLASAVAAAHAATAAATATATVRNALRVADLVARHEHNAEEKSLGTHGKHDECRAVMGGASDEAPLPTPEPP
jgi:hypothetical protein